MIFYLIGGLVVLYLLAGAVISGARYGDIKDRADASGIPRWYEYIRQTVMWAPMAVLSNKGR